MPKNNIILLFLLSILIILSIILFINQIFIHNNNAKKFEQVKKNRLKSVECPQQFNNPIDCYFKSKQTCDWSYNANRCNVISPYIKSLFNNVYY